MRGESAVGTGKLTPVSLIEIPSTMPHLGSRRGKGRCRSGALTCPERWRYSCAIRDRLRRHPAKRAARDALRRPRLSYFV